jgi:hypothetical protein
MKSITFIGLATLCAMVATEALAAQNPKPCGYLRSACKSASPAAVCDKAYQDAVAHNGAWNGPLYRPSANDTAIAVTNCAI